MKARSIVAIVGIGMLNACSPAATLKAERLAVDAAQFVCVVLPEQDAPVCAAAVDFARAIVSAQQAKDAGDN